MMPKNDLVLTVSSRRCASLLLVLLSASLWGCGDGGSSSDSSDPMTTPDQGLMVDAAPEPEPVTPPPSACGDHEVTGDEECDDGNFESGDGCDPSCLVERCGNGVLQYGERCDDGSMNSDTAPDACRLSCVPPRCGDSVTDRGEGCDDGNQVETDACHVNCTPATCGDGVLREDLSEGELGFERCDDGPLNSDLVPNACRSDCAPARCGDGVRDEGEECDLGMLNSSERGSRARCRADCRLPRCGDGVDDERAACRDQVITEPSPLCGNGNLDEGEECDEGDQNTDEPVTGEREEGALTCRTSCLLARCGDGIRDLSEACDDGNQRAERCLYGEESCLVCDSSCELVDGLTSYCGDGVLDERELCDDGGADRGCDDNCRPEGLSCGNSLLDEGEDCDDSNNLDGDGCSFDCRDECGNGVLDFGERCDDGLLNQTSSCDKACSYGRALVLHGESRLIGALPMRDPDAAQAGERAELYSDEYVFQVDGPSELRACLTLPSNEDPLPINVLTLSLERLTSLEAESPLTLDFDSGAELLETSAPDETGCVTFERSAIEDSGVYRLKVSVAEDFNPAERAELSELGVLRLRNTQLHYGLKLLLSQGLTATAPAYGRAHAEGDDLYLLTLSEPSFVGLRVSYDELGACPEREGLARPSLLVLTDQDGAPGSLFAQAHSRVDGALSACSSLLSQSAWPAGRYWVQVSAPEGDLRSTGAYVLDARLLGDCGGAPCPPEGLIEPRARRVVTAEASYVDHLQARPSEPSLTTLRAQGHRYDFRVFEDELAEGGAKQMISAALSGCADGASLELSLWSVDELGQLGRQLNDAEALALTGSLDAEEPCRQLTASLSPGRYTILARHKAHDELSSAEQLGLELRATLPYQLDLKRSRSVGVGGHFRGQLEVAPERDAPRGVEPTMGLVTGEERYTLSLDRAQQVSLSLQIEGESCELTSTAGRYPVTFSFALQLQGSERARSLKDEEELSELEAQGLVLLSDTLGGCGGTLSLFLPAGLHQLTLQGALDQSALTTPFTEEELLSAALPIHTLTLSLPALCGNGITEGVEGCDDGNDNELDYCTSLCQPRAICGDGRLDVELGEQCDDSNLTPFDGCSPECVICGDGELQSDRGEVCDPLVEGEVNCDQYCTFETITPQSASFSRSRQAIPAGETDVYKLKLRAKAWLTARTLGCEPELAGEPRRFDTTLSLREDTVEATLIQQSTDLGESACSRLVYYNQEERDAQITVESDRFNEVLDYQLEVKQRVELLLDERGLCVRSPTAEDPSSPRDACEGNGEVSLEGTLHSASGERHTVRLLSRGESELKWTLSKPDGEDSCPRAWLSGSINAEGNPELIELSGEADNCGSVTDRPSLQGQRELHLQVEDTDVKYELKVEVYEAGAVCGNGYVDLGEECDLGELNSDDEVGSGLSSAVCRTSCRLPYCGDRVVDRGERCDDGNDDNSDACLSCEPARCGDHEVQVGVEACDDGNSDNTDDCTTQCELARCGDGYIQPERGETCDDEGEGCADCVLRQRCENGQYIPVEDTCPEPEPIPVCGNGAVEEGESCDDGGNSPFDGCDELCQRERVPVLSGLSRFESDSALYAELHLYELQVDGPSQLLAQTSAKEGVSSCDANSPSAGLTLTALDTVLNLYEVDSSGQITRLLASVDDYSDLFCSRLEQTLYRSGRYVLEVASYGAEPLSEYELQIQLTRDLTLGEPLQGRLLPGESDIYELTLYDHRSRDFSLSVSPSSELSFEVIDRPRARSDEPLALEPAATSLSGELEVSLSTELSADPFAAGLDREPLDRAYVRVTRDPTASGELVYMISTQRRCGDGVLNLPTERRIITGGEECDDGNLSDGDGCSAWCRVERELCGNGIREQGEACDSGHLLTNLSTPPNFARTGLPSAHEDRYEMSYSALLYFTPPSQEDSQTIYFEPFIIDSTGLDFEGAEAYTRARLSFALELGEFRREDGFISTAGIASRINEAFPDLIEAWGRGDELSLIIKGGLRSETVQVLTPEGGPWNQLPAQALCDDQCTPTRKRLSAHEDLTSDGFEIIQGSTPDGGRDLYLIDIDDQYALTVYTTRCAPQGDSPPQDTVMSLYRMEGGELSSLVQRSNDLESSAILNSLSPDHRFCSMIEESTLSAGRYALYVEGYLGSPLKDYELRYSLRRQAPQYSDEQAVVRTERLLYDEFSDLFTRQLHALPAIANIAGRIILLDTAESLISIEDCITVAESESLNALSLKLSDSACVNPTLEERGEVRYAYAYCAEESCNEITCGNGRLDPNEECDDSDQIDDNGCTNTCKENGYDIDHKTGDDITEVTVPAAPQQLSLLDDSVAHFTIPNGQSFWYFNKSYNQVTVSSNGFITLSQVGGPVDTVSGCCFGQFIPINSSSFPLIAAYWEDLLGSTLTGLNQWWVDQQELFIQWKDVQHYRSGNPVTVTIVLSLTSPNVVNPDAGQIKIICESCMSDGGNHTQGIRGPYPLQGHVYGGRAAFSWEAFDDEVIFTPRITPLD